MEDNTRKKLSDDEINEMADKAWQRAVNIVAILAVIIFFSYLGWKNFIQ